MRVNKLTLRNFRNYVNLSVSFTHNVNIFIGNNAQGKTNILEAIYLGAMGRSYRTAHDADLIRWQQYACSIELELLRQAVEHRLALKFIRQQNKEIIYNGYTIRPRDLVGTLTAVLFSPEDLMLIKGSPAGRRRFLDTEISQVNPAYYRQLMQYNKILMQRNNLLKKIRERKASVDQLIGWDEQLVQTAVFLIDKRMQALKKIGMLANLMHRKLTASKENLAVSYKQHYGQGAVSTSDLTTWYFDNLAAMREEDIARGTTNIGPHRDDLNIAVNNIDLKTFGSQGQQRTGVLSLKLAELEFMKSETGEYPILLLDDVMSELDALRREQLLNFIKDRIQTFITATEKKYFSAVNFGKYYYVHNGTITE